MDREPLVPEDQSHKRKKRRSDYLHSSEDGYEGQDGLRIQAMTQLGIPVPRSNQTQPVSCSSSLSSSSLSSSSLAASTSSSDYEIELQDGQVLVRDRATQTDEWKTLVCENCKSNFSEDDDSVLCANCAYWNHYKCLKRKVYDGDNAIGADECTFCYAMETKLPKQEIMMNNRHGMIKSMDNQLDNDDPELPNGSPESWQYFWNITRVPGDGRNFKVGDHVYIADNDKQVVVVWFIDYLFRDSTNVPFANVTELCFPENIMRFEHQKFYPNEVYLMTSPGKTYPTTSVARLDALRGPPLVTLSVLEYRRYIPRCIPPAHVYIERHYYDRSSKNPHKYTTKLTKSGDYRTCLKNFALKLRETPLDPVSHYDQKFNKINWSKIRIQPSELTST